MCISVIELFDDYEHFFKSNKWRRAKHRFITQTCKIASTKQLIWQNCQSTAYWAYWPLMIFALFLYISKTYKRYRETLNITNDLEFMPLTLYLKTMTARLK